MHFNFVVSLLFHLLQLRQCASLLGSSFPVHHWTTHSQGKTCSVQPYSVKKKKLDLDLISLLLTHHVYSYVGVSLFHLCWLNLRLYQLDVPFSVNDRGVWLHLLWITQPCVIYRLMFSDSVFYSQGVSEPTRSITLAVECYFHLYVYSCHRSVLLHRSSVSGCWEWQSRLTVSLRSSHELTVVFCLWTHKDKGCWFVCGAEYFLMFICCFFSGTHAQRGLVYTQHKLAALALRTNEGLRSRLLISQHSDMEAITNPQLSKVWRKYQTLPLLSSACDIECIPGVHLRVSVVAAAGK